MVNISGWRGLVLLIVVGVAFVVLATAVLWLALVVGIVGALLWLRLVTFRRLAVRLRIPALVLDVVLVAALLAGGWFMAGTAGAAVGGLAWLVAFAGPQIAKAWLRRRVRQVVTGGMLGTSALGQPVSGVACQRCGIVSFATSRCPSCGSPLVQSASRPLLRA